MDQQKASIDYLRLARRVAANRWRLMLIIFIAIAVPTIVATLVATENTYEASATLFLLPEKTDPGLLREFTIPEVNSLYQVILTSRTVAQGVVETLPKESRDELSRRIGFRDYLLIPTNYLRRWRGEEVIVYSPSEMAIRELREARMNFNIAKDGTVTISATAFSPRVAADLANTYVEVLLSRSSSYARAQARETREMLEGLLAQARTGQIEAQESLRKFQSQGTTVVKLPDEARVDLQRLATLESSLADVQVNREIAQNRLAYLKGDKSKGSQSAGIDVTTQPLREKITQMETKLAGLADKYTEQHPLVQSARAELSDAQERLKGALQGTQTPRPGGATALKPLESSQLSKQMADLEVEVISLQTKEQGIQARIGRLKSSMAAMGAREQQYSELARGAETQGKLTGMLAEKLTAARISEQAQIRGIQVVDLATPPRQPSSKKPLKLMLMGLLGGLGLGLAAAVLLEYAGQVVESEHEVGTASGLPVLGSIPIALTPAGMPVTGDTTPAVFVATRDPHSLPADACRAIRTTIDCHNLEQPLKTLLVTSPGAHEGKSTVLLNLALAFAESGRRVLVIDADLRRPSLHRAAGVPNENGLADLLNKGESLPDTLRRVGAGVDFLPSGIRAGNPGSLLSSRPMTRLLEQARERYDMVLIDTPPVVAVSDCLPLSAQVDGVLLVTRFGQTQRRNIVRARQLLEKVGAQLIGVVINGLSPRETRRQYAEYNHYVNAAPSGRKKKRRSMKSFFTRALLAAAILGAATTAHAAEEEYRIGTEDVLHIIVWDNKDLEQTVIVRPDGKISFPLAGEIQAQDLTVPQLTDVLTQKLSASVKSPNVSVMVKEIRSFRVHFVGKITKPGVYPIKAGTPLLQALTLAGGPSENADLGAAYIIRGDKRMPIDLRKLIQEGDLSKNVKLEREDTFVVPEIALGSNLQEMQERRIYVLGKVAKPGIYNLKEDVPILHALFLAGGVAEGGDMASAFVIRGKEKIPVDLWKLTQKGDVSQNVMIKHADTIIVPAGGELQNAVYIMGEVTKPGVYSQPEALSLLKLVSLAGGFTKYAAPGRATLIRRDGDKKVLMKVDLKDIMNDPKANEDLSLRPGDVLIVPERLF